jgi:APA family basic amino acid/polyamine antiporter
MSDASAAGKLGLWSGVGLVVANMVGVGVLTSVGFMVTYNGLGPGHVIWAWLVGGVIALLGTQTYAVAARLMPHSGGEYRYLSDLWHPALGTFAGWSSLLVGFAPPIALDAMGVGGFAARLGVPLDPRLVGTAMVVLVTALHMIGLRASRRTQNILVGEKIALDLVFTGCGLIMGQHAWPTWVPKAGPALPVDGFLISLFFVAFCYSGWNAAIYAADQFAAPRRDVPRAMFIGCALVMVLYLVLNWVFVTNLDPTTLGTWAGGDTETITLGHVLMRQFVGPLGAAVMSVFMIIVLTSAASAMTMVGPRVYAAMADDGYLKATEDVLKAHGGLWFWDESFVISRKRDL